MLSSGRLLAVTIAHAFERHSAETAWAVWQDCLSSWAGSKLGSRKPPAAGTFSSRAIAPFCGSIYGSIGARSLAQQSADAKDPADSVEQECSSVGAGASKVATPIPAASKPSTPLAPPPTSAEARALADTLRQSSPTGRLLDLFTPTSSRQPPGTTAAVAVAMPPAARGVTAADATTSADTDVVRVILRGVENCKPLMKIQQNKAGNKVLLVPKPLDPEQSTNFAIKWIVQAAQKRRDAGRGRVPMADCLAAELLLAYQRKGSARARRDEVHKLALDNRANVRARWW
ncbi:hypothetical protein Vretimale_5741 [Volvox reticuliferus]|uniref:Small ribosomal subunit protein uS7 domain-containing protein n=1 Tax=Volvox reticuliferus TaxID=1737510 RepID=A0A8J4C5V2_9CHLO|nr:hypothetical protein Vretifemale_5838 [Volvox reticuliferus]GIM00834.1 hypothetical protein Vretimale_5741 [Volvox reticuliferus]